MNKICAMWLGILSITLLGGCATSRSVVEIRQPSANKEAAPAAPPNGKEVYISRAVDTRIFEEAPSDPSTPSLSSRKARGASVQARAIARKRNAYGMALGDVLLKDGDSVEALVTSAIRQAYAEKGYKVIDNRDNVGASTLLVDAKITKFWSWFTPGAIQITLRGNVATELTIDKMMGVKQETVSVQVAKDYMTSRDSNWIDVVNAAVRAYIDELKTKIE